MKNHHRLTLVTLLSLLLLLLISGVATGLPFRTRGGGKDDDDGDEPNSSHSKSKSSPQQKASKLVADAVIDNGHIRYISTSSTSIKNKKNQNDIVQAFFASNATTTTTSTATSESEALSQDIWERASQLEEFLVSTRRTLHRHPELMYQEEETSKHVQHVLNELGISYTTGWAVNTVPDIIPGKGGYGIVADIGTGGPPCVLLRADMDALPIVERTQGVDDFKSQSPGKMHACGHDGHTTMLLGAASILKEMEDSIHGTIRLMFQPAEEGGAGGKRMREEGVLTKAPQVQLAYGMHLWPTLPSGVVASRRGPLLAACERFEILIAGVGGHAAMPHLTVDPIVTASSMIMNLQTLVSRNLSPLESGVCSITKFEAGDAFNIIPASALLRGTIRALSTETLLALKEKVHHVVESTAAVYGCNVTITYSPDYYPPTVNDPELFESFSKHVGALVSKDGQLVQDIEPTMGAEDFSFVAEDVPSTFFLLGQGSAQAPDAPPSHYGLHHPQFAIDESVLPRGVALHVNLALRSLQKLRAEEEQSRNNTQGGETTAQSSVA